MHLHKLFCTFELLYGKQLVRAIWVNMVYEGTVKSTSNIALAALFWSLSSMTEVQLPQITQQQYQNGEECKHCKTVFYFEKREKL